MGGGGADIPSDAETVIGIAAAGCVAVAGRGTAPVGIFEIRAAPEYIARGFAGWRDGIFGVADIARWIWSIDIRAPLIDIAGHIVEAKEIGLFFPYGMGALAFAVGFKPANLIGVCIVGARVPWGLGIGPGGVFKFGLGGKAKAVACFFRGPIHEGFGVADGDNDRGMIAFLSETRVFPVVFGFLDESCSIEAKAAALAFFGFGAVSGIADKALELIACDREFSDIKIFGQRDFALGFVGFAARFGGGRALYK